MLEGYLGGASNQQRRNHHGYKKAAEAGQVAASDELFAAHSRPLSGLRQERKLDAGLDRWSHKKSAWWEGCKTGRFPKPIKLGPRTTVWRAEEILEFIERIGAQVE